jgi:pentatricopeptide repeat protein
MVLLFLCFLFLYRRTNALQQLEPYFVHRSAKMKNSFKFRSPMNSSPFKQARNSRRWQTVCFASSTSAAKKEDAKKVKRYLSQESFPLGSFDSQVATNIFTSMKALSAKNASSPKAISLVIELLDRLLQESELKHDQSKTQKKKDVWGDGFVVPKNTLSSVLEAWKRHYNDRTTDVSPRKMFELMKAMETSFASARDDVVPYTLIIDASQDPELGEEILDYLSEGGEVRDVATIRSFRHVIDAWAKSSRKDAPHRAEALLQKMANYGITPNIVVYNTVITAWANSHHKDAPQRAEDLLHEMRRLGLDPNEISYSSVLTTWARSKKDYAPDRAYAILTHVARVYEKNVTYVKPNIFCCSAVIIAYVKHGNAKRAEQTLLEQCERYEMTKDPDLLPNVLCFNSVINAWSKSGQPEAAHMAEALLQRMQDFAKSWNESSLFPDTVSFNSVLNAWARSKERDAPYKCEDVLQRMNSLYKQGYANCQPNVVSFDTVINCWAKSRIPEGPERAEAILRHMHRLCKAGNKNVQPNIVTYSTVMNAWAGSNHPDAALRAQALFDELVNNYQVGSERDLKPDTTSFATLISAWGRSKHKDSAAKAQKVFNDMVALYKAGDKDLQPTKIHYTTLLDAWAKAGQPEMAENILRKLEREALKPHIFCYNAVMNGWAKSRSPDAAQRAQALFDEAVQIYEAGDRNDMKPDVRTYSTLISAWGRSNSKDKAAKAQTVFNDLMDRYRLGDKDLQPDVFLYSALIDAWVKAGNPEQAELILRKMESESGIKPVFIAYYSVLDGWSRSCHPEAPARMQSLYDEMKRKRQTGDHKFKIPVAKMFDKLLTSWLGSGRKDGFSKAEAVFKDLHTRCLTGDSELKPVVEKYCARFGAHPENKHR